MPLRPVIALLLTCALVASGCQSPPARPTTLAQPVTLELPPLPPQIKKREPNLTQRLLQLLQPSSPKATKPSTTSTP